MRTSWPALASVVVVGAAAAQSTALVDAVTGAPAVGVELALPFAYVLLSPLSRVLDALSLFSIPQHIAAALTSLVAAVAWTWWSGRAEGPPRQLALRGGRAAALALLGLAATIVAAAGAPRPMAALRAAAPDEVRVDFHSHTTESHDTRESFDFEANREWHAASGFDVAYVADHIVREGTKLADPPAGVARAGDGTVLLTAREARHLGMDIIILGFAADDSALVNERRWLQPGRLVNGRMPLSIAAIPGPLADLEPEALDQPPWVVGIEVSDGAPRGLAQLDRERDELVALADRLGIVLVSGSNLHGWGRTAAAWTLVSVPGWRELAPAALGARIEEALRLGADAPVRVVERWRPRPGSALGVAVTVPWTVGGTVAGLTWPERLAWLGWIWGLALLPALLRRRAAPPMPVPSAELLGAR
jgi:hypothetical protein